MAQATIEFSEPLPNACVVCGDRSANSTLVTIPPSFTPTFQAPMAFSHGYTVLKMPLPLCARHKSHFWPQVGLRYMLIAGVIGMPCLLILMGLISGSELIAFIGIGSALVPPVLYVLASAMLNRNLVHPIAFSGDSITFANVSADFVTAKNALKASLHEDSAASSQPPVENQAATSGATSVGKWVIGAIGLVGVCSAGCCGFTALAAIAFHSRTRPQPQPTTVVRSEQKRVAKQDRESERQNESHQESDDFTLADYESLQPNPLPIAAGWEPSQMQVTHLSDMQEFDVIHGWGAFGKDGKLGYLAWSAQPTSGNDPISVKGEKYPKGISFTAPIFKMGRARYRLDKNFKMLRGKVALNDMPPQANVDYSEVPGCFVVVGDGRCLWKSKPIHEIGESEDFLISVESVELLELQVYKPGKKGHGLTVWPVLELLQ